MRVSLLSADPAVPLGGPRGASVRLRGLALGLRREGHEVDAIAVSRGDARDLAPLEAAGVGIRDLKHPATAREIDWHYARCRPDLVVERLSALSAIGATTAAACGTAHIYDAGLPAETERPGALQEGLFASLGAIAANEDIADWLRPLAADGFPVRVVPNGAAASCFEEPDAARVEKLRVALRLETSPFVVGYLGPLRPGDGVEWMLEAVARVANPRPHLLLVGDGPARNDLIRAAFEKELPAAFASWVPHDDIPSYLALCNAVVVPGGGRSPRSAPIGLVEAMAAARPVVAARLPGTERILFDGHSGILVAPGDVPAMAAALERFARDHAAAARFGAAARRAVSQRYTWDEGADLLVEFAGELPARRDLAG